MDSRMLPFFFLINNTGASQGDTLGHMNPFSSNSYNYFFNSTNSTGVILYGAFEMSFTSGTNSIENSISHLGGNLGTPFGNTS